MLQLYSAGVKRTIIAQDLGKNIKTVNKWLNQIIVISVSVYDFKHVHKSIKAKV